MVSRYHFVEMGCEVTGWITRDMSKYEGELLKLKAKYILLCIALLSDENHTSFDNFDALHCMKCPHSYLAAQIPSRYLNDRWKDFLL